MACLIATSLAESVGVFTLPTEEPILVSLWLRCGPDSFDRPRRALEQAALALDSVLAVRRGDHGFCNVTGSAKPLNEVFVSSVRAGERMEQIIGARDQLLQTFEHGR